MTNLINHQFATGAPIAEGSMFTYVAGANGIFAKAARPGIEVMMPIAPSTQSIKGLQPIEPYLKVTPKVPEELLMTMWRLSCTACHTGSTEILFHLVLDNEQWQFVVPEQEQTAGTCTPLQQTGSTQQAAIEIHSHGAGEAHFSPIDDRDERFGFRIYGVLGKVRMLTPEMILRVGLFGHGWIVPLEQVFEFEGHQFIKDLSRPYELMNWHSIEAPELAQPYTGEIAVEPQPFKSSAAIEIADPKTIAWIYDYRCRLKDEPPKFDIGDVVIIHDQETAITNTVGLVMGSATYEARGYWQYAVMPIVDSEACETNWFGEESLFPARIGLPSPGAKSDLPLEVRSC